jgi:methyl-accepting chemotaxis protein
MAATREDRKKVWVDQFQTRLFTRLCAYLAIYLFCLVNLLFVWRLIGEGPGNPLAQYAGVLVDYAPALIILAVMLPFLAYDAIRFSHRLVGPLARIRDVMEAVANGDPVRIIKLRDGDFPIELRDDFNRMLEALQKHGIPVLKPNDGQGDSQRQTA